MSTTPTLNGVDISHANAEPISLHGLVKVGNLTFIALKATEGTSWVDPTFVDRLHRILQFLPNVYVIAYHFLRVDSSAAEQMAHFHAVLKQAGYFDNPRCLAPAIDAERGLQGQEPSRVLTVAAIQALTQLAGCKPGLYSGQAYWQDHFTGIDGIAYRWIARYSAAAPVIGFDIWQDSETRVIGGRPYDHNVVYMSVPQFVSKMSRPAVKRAAA